MISSLKIAHVLHLAVLKAAAAKAAIGVGVLVAGAGTGLVATDILGPDYLDSVSALINQTETVP